MDYLILIMVIMLNSAFFIVGGAYGKKDKIDSVLFTSLSALATLLFFLLYNRFTFVYDGRTTIIAIASALLYIVCIVSNVEAMKYGSVALTSMVASFSLLLPAAFGIVYWNEPVSSFFPIGIVLFCVSVVLSNIGEKSVDEETMAFSKNLNSKVGDEKKHNSILWAIFALVLFLSNGFSSILTIYHQKTGGEKYRGELMLISMHIVFAVNAAYVLFKRKKDITRYLKDAAIYGGSYGLLNAGIQLGVMILCTNGVISQSVFFPVISAGVLIVVFVVSRVLFKERFSKCQYIGVATGVASIVLLQM